MQWNQKHKENQRLIYQYMAFIQSQPFKQEAALKLMSEIGRLNSQNEYIDAMTVQEYYSKIEYQLILQDSIL